MSLWEDFLNNKQREVCKWTHYFPVYERFFSPFKNKTLTFLEIGVNKGGSLQLWSKYFGPLATIIGIDINSVCSTMEDNNVKVRIGDQSNSSFLQSIVDEFGIPDIILDDGSHMQAHIRASFDFFYPKMHNNSIYMVEDLHTAYWPSHGGVESSSFINYSKGLIDTLNADHTHGKFTSNDFTKNTFGIHFYDSMVVFEKGEIKLKKAITTGTL